MVATLDDGTTFRYLIDSYLRPTQTEQAAIDADEAAGRVGRSSVIQTHEDAVIGLNNQLRQRLNQAMAPPPAPPLGNTRSAAPTQNAQQSMQAQVARTRVGNVDWAGATNVGPPVGQPPPGNLVGQPGNQPQKRSR
jgi:hypothetical protein